MTQSNTLRKFVTAAGAAAALAGGSALAGDYGKAIIDDKMPIEDSWSLCDIFDYSTLYEGESGFIKEIALTGRYHGQHISQQEDYAGNVNNGYHKWQHRRARLGLDIEFAGGVTLYSSLNVSNGSGPGTPFTTGRFFDDFDEVGIEWETDSFAINVGKQKQKITREFSTSSKRIKTIERSPIVNEIADQKPWGVTVGFETGEIEHTIGGWLYGSDDDWNTPRSNSRGGFSYHLEMAVTDKTDFLLDYVYTNNSGGTVGAQGNAPGGNASPYEHAVSFGTVSDFGRLGLTTDLIFAANRTSQRGDASISQGSQTTIPAGNDTWGFVIMPTYEITEKLEAVFKYAYMDEGRQQRTQRFGYNSANGFDGQVRQVVESYHTIYAGLNYYLCKDKAKVMFGYEYATGEEYDTGTSIDSGTWMAAFRTYF